MPSTITAFLWISVRCSLSGMWLRKLFSALHCWLPENPGEMALSSGPQKDGSLMRTCLHQNLGTLGSMQSRGQQMSLMEDLAINIFGFAGHGVPAAATWLCHWGGHRQYVNSWTRLCPNKSWLTKPGFRPTPDVDGHGFLFCFVCFVLLPLIQTTRKA